MLATRRACPARAFHSKVSDRPILARELSAERELATQVLTDSLGKAHKMPLPANVNASDEEKLSRIPVTVNKIESYRVAVTSSPRPNSPSTHL